MLSGRTPPIDVGNRFVVPRSDIARTTFSTEHRHLTTFDMSYLIPLHVDEVLPGDVHKIRMISFARLNNLIFPMMSNVRFRTWGFFVPARLLWVNWQRFMGERDNPGDSISFTIPQLVSPAGGFAVGSIMDYFGLPCVGQLDGGATVSVNALPLRAYNLIYNEWFRDENLQNAVFNKPSASGPGHTFDGPDNLSAYALFKKNKVQDPFTSALPWPQKVATVAFPLAGTATVIPSVSHGSPTFWNQTAASNAGGLLRSAAGGATAINIQNAGSGAAEGLGWNDPKLVADLSTVSGGVDLNAIRVALATQQFLEKDARSGTRYSEIVFDHFGIRPQDSRLQRPEYIGGGDSIFQTQAIPQTSASNLTGGSTPLGALSGQATAGGEHSYECFAQEHGFIVVLGCVFGDIIYQNGLRRMWTRTTRLEHFHPVFDDLGEEAIRNDEIYVRGNTAGTDAAAFAYQERWWSYRHFLSLATGKFRSKSAGTIDPWHMSENLGALPLLNSSFITDQSNVTAVRNLAAGAAANGMQILFDSLWSIKRTRAMKMHSVPGLSRF